MAAESWWVLHAHQKVGHGLALVSYHLLGMAAEVTGELPAKDSAPWLSHTRFFLQLK